MNLIINIFLTGKIHVGKSTIINKLLADYSGSVGGFRTLPFFQQGRLNGFYFVPLLKELVPKELPFIGRCLEDDSWEGYHAVFDHFGTRVLNACLQHPAGLCIMDELGFFESNAEQFQKKVFEVLNSQIPVLGVIKQADNAFLNAIRIRGDVEIITVTEGNRDKLYRALVERGDISCLSGRRKI